MNRYTPWNSGRHGPMLLDPRAKVSSRRGAGPARRDLPARSTIAASEWPAPRSAAGAWARCPRRPSPASPARPGRRPPAASAGLTIRHGPHHGAHMSTTTGTDAASATSAKVSSPASTIQGSGWWQLPQRGVYPPPLTGRGLSARSFGHLDQLFRIIDLSCVIRVSPYADSLGHGELSIGVPDPDPRLPPVASPLSRARPTRVSTSRADEPAQRPGAVDRVESLLSDGRRRLRR